MAETAHSTGHDFMALFHRPDRARLTGDEELDKVQDLLLLVWGQGLTELCHLFWHVHQRTSSESFPGRTRDILNALLTCQEALMMRSIIVGDQAYRQQAIA